MKRKRPARSSRAGSSLLTTQRVLHRGSSIRCRTGTVAGSSARAGRRVELRAASTRTSISEHRRPMSGKLGDSHVAAREVTYVELRGRLRTASLSGGAASCPSNCRGCRVAGTARECRCDVGPSNKEVRATGTRVLQCQHDRRTARGTELTVGRMANDIMSRGR